LGKRIGQRIRGLRTAPERSWTQETLAERANLSVSFLSMVERGERVPHVHTLADLASALGIRLRDLFDGVDAPESDRHDAPDRKGSYETAD
jgi:transcriptional regulator with XRE-family HTH domain